MFILGECHAYQKSQNYLGNDDLKIRKSLSAINPRTYLLHPN